jgi:Spy/CpxP family protein refolding chaperone
MEEDTMKKLAYVIAAVCAIAVAAPSVANAEKVIIKRGHHHEWHHDRGWHQSWRHHDHDRVVIKHRDYRG